MRRMQSLRRRSLRRGLPEDQEMGQQGIRTQDHPCPL